MAQKTPSAPASPQPTQQIKVHSGLNAGASLQACLVNLDYWKKAFDKNCMFR
ncbi:MAG: hypothetical protein ACKOC5_19490 [Chloroflexota bacterium]